MSQLFLDETTLEYFVKKISSLLLDIFITTFFFFIKIIIRIRVLSVLSIEYFDTVSWTTFETSCKYIFCPQKINFKCRITFQFFNALFSIYFFFFLQYLFLSYKMSAYFIILIKCRIATFSTFEIKLDWIYFSYNNLNEKINFQVLFLYIYILFYSEKINFTHNNLYNFYISLRLYT